MALLACLRSYWQVGRAAQESIGQAAKMDSVEIKWPSGQIDKLTNLPINTYIKVVEGKGVESAPKTGH